MTPAEKRRELAKLRRSVTGRIDRTLAIQAGGALAQQRAAAEGLTPDEYRARMIDRTVERQAREAGLL